MNKDAFVYVCQHHDAEPPGTLGDVLRKRGVEMRVVKGFRGEAVPAQIGDAAGLVVMGGPMGALEGERHPFLVDEAALIQDALSRQLPMLGICLGAQLLAHALGASVTKGSRPEIGWHPLQLTEAAARDPHWAKVASPCMAFHWHADCFSLPPGATSLASSDATPCQAFRFGTGVYGLQCHLEVNEALVEDWLALWGDSLPAAGETADGIRGRARRELPTLARTARTVFGAWADALAP